MFFASSSLSVGRYVNAYYKPAKETDARPIGKCFVPKADDETLAFMLVKHPN